MKNVGVEMVRSKDSERDHWMGGGTGHNTPSKKWWWFQCVSVRRDREKWKSLRNIQEIERKILIIETWM